MKKKLVRGAFLAAAVLSAAALASMSPGGASPGGQDPLADTPINISRSATDSGGPLVGVDASGAAYAVWTEFQGKRNFFFSTNKSGQWTTPRMIEQVVYDSDESGFPHWAVSPTGQCHLSWQDGRLSSYDIFHIAVDTSLSSTTNVSEADQGGSAYSSVAVNPVDNSAYVVWMDGTVRDWEIFLRFRSPAGAWGAIQTIPVGTGDFPDLAFDPGGTAHLTWHTRTGPNSTVWYSRNSSPQNVSQWTQPIIIRGSTGLVWSYPKIDCDKAGNAYFIWLDKTQGNEEIFLRKANANGTLSEEVNVSKSAGASVEGDIAVNKDNGTINVAWAEGGEIYLSTYQAGNWSGPKNMTNTPAADAQPSLVLDAAGNLHMVYAEVVGGNWDIMYLGTPAGNPPPPPVVKPKPPLEPALSTRLADSRTVKINTLSWKRNPLNQSIEIKNYRVFRKASNLPDSAFAVVAAVSGGAFSFEDFDLPLSMKFTYAVTALSQAGQVSDPSDFVTETTTFPPLLASCTSVTNSSLFKREKINVVAWQKNPLNEAVTVLKYDIYRKKSDQEDSQYQKIASVGGGVFEYRDRKLEAGDRFYYFLKAVDTGGTESEKSNVAREGS